MARRRVLGTVNASALNVPPTTTTGRGGKGGTNAASGGKHSQPAPSAPPPSILRPIARTRSGVGRKTKSHNRTLAHQPLGKSNWLRGDHLDASTTYEAWRGNRDRDRGRDEDDASDEDPLASSIESFDFSSLEDKEERFNPEEVDTLVSIITEREDAELTVSPSVEDAEAMRGGSPGCREAPGTTGTRERGNVGEHGVAARRTHRDNPLQEDEENDDGGGASDPEEGEEAPEDSTDFGAPGRGFGESGSFELELSASSHMVVIDRVVKLEIEKERAAKKLGDWAKCAGELRKLYEEKAHECRGKDALILDLRRRLDQERSRAEKEARSMRKSLEDQGREMEEVGNSLRQEIQIKDELLKESNESCRKLRTALLDAELEIDRQDKSLALSCGADGDQFSNRGVHGFTFPPGGGGGGDTLASIREELERKAKVLQEKEERIMKQDFELQRAKVQVHQQRQQIDVLTQSLSQARSQAQSGTNEIQGAEKAGDQEKGELIEELAHQIEEGSREIKMIQEELLAANPKIFAVRQREGA